VGITYGYCELPLLKAYLDIQGAKDDPLLELTIEGASRFLDEETGHRFYAVAGEAREYTARSGSLVIPDNDDIVAVTALKTDDDNSGTFETTWVAATDYRLAPVNNALKGLPYWQIITRPNGTYSFPRTANSVQVTGSFGWCATGSHPTEITRACMLLAARFHKRRETPTGAITMAEAVASKLWARLLDPEVREIIEHYKLVTIA
jgi:hypothetical protein